jgi:preprotein translocase subunit SecA
VLDYDDVLNKQREIIYELRKKLLLGEDVRQRVLTIFEEVTDNLLATYANEKIVPEEWDLQGLLQAVYTNLLPPKDISIEDLDGASYHQIREQIIQKTLDLYQSKEDEIGAEHLRNIERFIMLRTIDVHWMDHLEAMDGLKEGIGLRAYAQTDPLVAYKIEAYQMFKEMRDGINEEIARSLTKFQMMTEEQAVKRPKLKNISTNLNEDGTPAIQQRQVGKKVGRNDPCPCGSGKKYKKCCGQSA